MAIALLASFITCALIVIALTAILNVLTMSRLGKAPQTDKHPRLSILIPARNEARVITNTIHHLLNQSYSNFEIILLDDNSSDGTGQIAIEAARNDSRLRIIQGKILPDGWAGKNWACHQLSELATGDYLIFTDADVVWQHEAFAALVNEIQRTNADLLTVWSTQQTATWGERLVVPLMAFVILGYLPHLVVNHIPLPVFAAANGQCMAFRKEAYRTIGGHEAVKNEIVEDIQLAQRIKAHQLRLRMTDGNQLVCCRMYNGWDEVRNGYAKNIIAGYGDSIPALLAATIFHWSLFLFPWGWLLQSLIVGNVEGSIWAGMLITSGIVIRALTARATHQRIQDALMLPVSVIFMTIIATQGIYWYWRYGGPRWKGRTISRQKSTGKV